MKIPQYFHLAFFTVLLTVGFVGCSSEQSSEKEQSETGTPHPTQKRFPHQSHPRHAQLFSIEYNDQTKVVRLKNPFDTTRLLRTYLLIPRGVTPDTSLPEGQVVRIPLERVALSQTTHIGFFNELGLLSVIEGISQKQYVKNQQVIQKITNGKIIEFGPSHNINVEKLLQVRPDLLFVAPFKDNKYKKAKDVGVPVAVNSSYMETTPLARAEWIKFISYFFNREKQADRIFRNITSHYQHISKLARQKKHQPTIFSGKKIGGIWYVPGGKSYMARFFEDAGAQYLWRENQESGSLALDFESVFYKARDADYWCIIENYDGPYSYTRLGSENIHYKDFEAFHRRNIIFCNTHKQPYYEEGILEPDVILADLISILHPDLLPDHRNKYYKILSQRK